MGGAGVFLCATLRHLFLIFFKNEKTMVVSLLFTPVPSETPPTIDFWGMVGMVGWLPQPPMWAGIQSLTFGNIALRGWITAPGGRRPAKQKQILMVLLFCPPGGRRPSLIGRKFLGVFCFLEGGGISNASGVQV